MATQYAYFQGSIVPLEQAKIGLMCHGFNYGTGCFEGLRAYWNPDHEELYILHLDAHLHRLRQSGKILYMDIKQTHDELRQITQELVKRCEYRQNVYIRPTIYKEDEVMGVRLHNLHDAISIYVNPIGQYVDTTKGLKVGMASWRRIDDNMIPARAKVTGAYINSALAKTEAHYNGYDEAIFLNQNGHVSEGSAENIFIIRNGTLITPAQTENILEGITRRSVIDIAKQELGLTVEARPIDRTELYVSDEMFLCGTGAQIAWVREVDHRKVSDEMGPITRRIHDLYNEAVTGQLPRYHHWLTPVYEKCFVKA